MNLMIWPGAKFEMDMATGEFSSHLEFSMVFQDYIYHSRTSRLRPILFSIIFPSCVDVQFLCSCADRFCSSSLVAWGIS
jgi:hypothetical protein